LDDIEFIASPTELSIDGLSKGKGKGGKTGRKGADVATDKDVFYKV
jgi:hypothetical protein